MNKTNLSVNLNKVALLRNARGSNYPSLIDVAAICSKHEICGITLHPRPDERHAKFSDLPIISHLVSNFSNCVTDTRRYWYE